MSGDTRLWMYRKGEARLFGHPDHVPHGEDWQRFPLSGSGAGEVSGALAAGLSQEEKLDRLPRKRLMQVAADCGVRFEAGWTKAELKQAIIEVLNGNGA